MKETVEERIMEIMTELKPGVDFEGRDDLMDSGILDSMTIVMVASEMKDEFDADIRVTDILPENFNSIESMAGMIERITAEE